MTLMEQVFIDQHKNVYDILLKFGDKMVGVDLDECYRRYAEALGRDNLTDAERHQAILAALLETAP